MESYDQLILVDEDDLEIGSGEKWRIHREGRLHRAFSIMIVDSRNSMLIQKRSMVKYHSAGLWSNAVCGHPTLGETIEAAAHRRLDQEMGFDCELRRLYEFKYKATVGNEIIENEYDHVLIGRYNGIPIPDPSEIAECKWIEIAELLANMSNSPEQFTFWFVNYLSSYVKQMDISMLESYGQV